MNTGILIAILVVICFLSLSALFIFWKTNKRLNKEKQKINLEKTVFPSYVSEKTRDSFTNSPPVSTSKRIITSHQSVRITSSRDNDSDLVDAIQTGVVVGLTAMATEKIVSSVFDSGNEVDVSSCRVSDSVVWDDDN